MFAPYWRAGLSSAVIDRGNAAPGVPADPDRQRAFDAELVRMLEAENLGEYAQAYQALANAGFRGIR